MTVPPSDDSFCLVTRPWIPVRTLDGEASVVGLRELFVTAHQLEGLAVALPPAASGLLRVLCAMAARVTGLHEATDDDIDSGGATDWLDYRYALLEHKNQGFVPEKVSAYLEKYGDRLRMHDLQRPFLQDPRLATESSSRSGVNKLVMARPAGNNQVFFGHFNDAEQVPLSSAEAALHLITQLYYGPSGQCTPRTVAGERYGNTTAGPLRRAMSYHPVGRSLYETLLLGIPAPGAWPQTVGAVVDACPWERDALPDPLAPPHGPVGPLSALTERYQHAVLLQPGPDGETVVDATVTWAFRSNRPAFKDPYLIWDEAKDGQLYPRDAVAERSLWRDLDALVLKERGDGGRRPPVLDGLTGGQIPGDVFASLRVFAYGFDQDGQTRDRTYFSASTPPLFALLETSDEPGNKTLALGVREGKESAEKAAWRLEAALRNAWREYSSPFGADKPGGKEHRGGNGPWPGAARSTYWPTAEGRFWELFHDRDFSNALPVFAKVALDVYDEVTLPVAYSPRGAKARENARGLVASLLRPRLLP
nr:type I-E CRISPR-associated protein Cse1/CasA [Streptomyces sp. NBC_00857]